MSRGGDQCKNGKGKLRFLTGESRILNGNPNSPSIGYSISILDSLNQKSQFSLAHFALIPVSLPKRVVEYPYQKQHNRDVHHELQRGVTDNVARFEIEDSQKGQHPKRMNEVGERFGRVIGLHDPTEMHLE